MKKLNVRFAIATALLAGGIVLCSNSCGNKISDTMVEANTDNIPAEVVSIETEPTSTIEDLFVADNYVEEAPVILDNIKGITTTDVNFRTGSSTEDEIIETLDGGTSINLLTKEINGWYKVEYNGVVGYISGDYVKELDMEANKLDNLPDIIPAVETTTDVNIRSIPSTENNEPIALLSTGTKLELVDKLDNGWYKVNYNDSFGYVSGDYVRDTYLIKGQPFKIVFMNDDSSLYQSPFGEVIGQLPEYETAIIYGETEDFFFGLTDQGIGFINKYQTTDLYGQFAVVDISDQRLIVYNNTNPVVITDVVTGKDSTPTNIGYFDIDSKSKNATLTGPGYSCPVERWMPFDGGIGLHDANWRYSFGGEIYHTNGSHGCVNIPVDEIYNVYDNLDVGDKVLVKK